MKKNGFLATSVLYSFFLCFCILMVGLLANYTHQALIFEKSSSPLTYEKQNLYLEIILPESGQSSSCYNVALGAISGETMTLGGKTFSGPWITISPKSNDLSGLYCAYYVADDNITQDGYVCTLYKDDECISWKYIGQV